MRHNRKPFQNCCGKKTNMGKWGKQLPQSFQTTWTEIIVNMGKTLAAETVENRPGVKRPQSTASINDADGTIKALPKT
jgi:hypothetical protein